VYGTQVKSQFEAKALIDTAPWITVSSMVDRDRERLKRIFDQDPALYDRARPRYPEQLFDDLFVLGGLEPGDAVLEIGCGTGQATSALARRGCRVVCVEIGEGLATVARRNLAQFPNVEVVTCAFERWESSGTAFSMVFAATSWHWLDPNVRYLKAASVLKSGGRLAIVSGGHAFPEGFDSFFTDIQACYNAIGEGVGQWPPARPNDVASESADIERSGLFGEVHVRRYLRAIEYTASEYIDLLNTYSDHRSIEPSRRDPLYAEIRRQIDARSGGRIRKHYLNILNVARLL
jgi:SAM-dependent methyltransferase